MSSERATAVGGKVAFAHQSEEGHEASPQRKPDIENPFFRHSAMSEPGLPQAGGGASGQGGGGDAKQHVPNMPPTMEEETPTHTHGRPHLFINQVKAWLENERQRQRDLYNKKRAAKRAIHQALYSARHPPSQLDDEDDGDIPSSSSTSSADEEALNSLDNLESILTAAQISEGRRSTPGLRRRSSSSPGGRLPRPKSLIGNTSDTDYASDGEPIVPACEARLGTMEEVGIEEFKRQVLMLAHTLRCKGWRRVPLDKFTNVEVKRISGALTNAVYTVSPPQDILPLAHGTNDARSSATPASTNPPAKLLLRIYGPQTSQLINREAELVILRRLARKRIGPRLLGTFENGRFEEFFKAKTLTKGDIRVPEISRQIAKRLKELHEGIELDSPEMRMGVISWSNWSKWIPRTRKIMVILDAKGNLGETGYVCASPWEKFESAVEKYSEWLLAKYGGDNMEKQIVFAHNDTQYGNIMKLETDEKSPLLRPGNEHKQLVVIDFEYASANTPGFEIANHFCEWMGDYHNPTAPHFLDHTKFPTSQEQRNFLRAYVEHSLSPSFPNRGTIPVDAPAEFPASPTLVPATGPSSPIPSFTLDSPIASYKEEEAARQSAIDAQVSRLEDEAKAWRPASHAMWCAWGIAQSRTPGEKIENAKLHGAGAGGAISEGVVEGGKENDGGGDGFDYLAYAQQRACLFWGDVLALGILTKEEVGEEVVRMAKVIV